MAEATRQDVIKLIEEMPDDVDLDDILYTLYVRSIVETGREDFRQGRTLSTEEVRKSVFEWLQSAGR